MIEWCNVWEWYNYRDIVVDICFILMLGRRRADFAVEVYENLGGSSYCGGRARKPEYIGLQVDYYIIIIVSSAVIGID